MIGITTALLAGLLCFPSQEDPKKAEAEEAVKQFKEAYAAAGLSEAGRAGAVHHLAGVPHKKTLSALFNLLLSNEVPAVKVAAADALAGFKDVPGAGRGLSAILDQTDKKQTDVRKAILRSLGDLRAAECIYSLHKIMTERPFDVAKEAIIALGKIRNRESIQHLINYLRRVEQDPASSEGAGGYVNVPRRGGGLPGVPPLPGGLGGIGIPIDIEDDQKERKEQLHAPVLAALRGITGKEFSPWKQWDAWWKMHGASFKVEK